MVISVLKDDIEVIEHSRILSQSIIKNLYIVPFEIIIITNISSLEEDEEYSIALANEVVLDLIIVSKSVQIIDGIRFTKYTFISEQFYKIVNDSNPFNIKYHNIDMKQCLDLNNQLSFINFELRKKSLLYITDDEFNVTTENVITVLNAPQIKDNRFVDDNVQSKIITDKKTRKNYISILEDGTVIKTKLGSGVHKFIQFLRKDEISSLDVFIEDNLEIKSNGSLYKLGEVLLFGEDKFAITSIVVRYIDGKSSEIMTLGAKAE